MKKFFLSLLLIFACAAGVVAQSTYSSIVNKFSNCSGAESVNIGPLLFSLCSFLADDEDVDFIKGISSMSIIDVSDCCEEVKIDFRKEINKLDAKGMELLMELAEDSDILKIFVKQKGDNISQFLLVNSGDDPCMVSINGKISMKDINKLIEQNK